jgi:hypothetical protein
MSPFSTKYRRRFTFDSYDVLKPIARLGIVLVIVQLFSPISFEDIFMLVESIFGQYKYRGGKASDIVNCCGRVRASGW